MKRLEREITGANCSCGLQRGPPVFCGQQGLSGDMAALGAVTAALRHRFLSSSTA